MSKNVVGWFEIPVVDMDRAVAYYQAVFGFELNRQQMGPLDMAWFPWVENGEGAPGSLVCYPDFYKPNDNGVLIYFTTPSGDLNQDLEKVKEAGGKVLQERTLIAEGYGYMAVTLDSEGNRIALHSRT